MRCLGRARRRVVLDWERGGGRLREVRCEHAGGCIERWCLRFCCLIDGDLAILMFGLMLDQWVA